MLQRFSLLPQELNIIKHLLTDIDLNAELCDPVEDLEYVMEEPEEPFWKSRITVGLTETQLGILKTMRTRLDYFSPNPAHYKSGK